MALSTYYDASTAPTNLSTHLANAQKVVAGQMSLDAAKREQDVRAIQEDSMKQQQQDFEAAMRGEHGPEAQAHAQALYKQELEKYHAQTPTPLMSAQNPEPSTAPEAPSSPLLSTLGVPDMLNVSAPEAPKMEMPVEPVATPLPTRPYMGNPATISAMTRAGYGIEGAKVQEQRMTDFGNALGKLKGLSPAIIESVLPVFKQYYPELGDISADDISKGNIIYQTVRNPDGSTREVAGYMGRGGVWVPMRAETGNEILSRAAAGDKQANDVLTKKTDWQVKTKTEKMKAAVDIYGLKPNQAITMLVDPNVSAEDKEKAQLFLDGIKTFTAQKVGAATMARLNTSNAMSATTFDALSASAKDALSVAYLSGKPTISARGAGGGLNPAYAAMVNYTMKSSPVITQEGDKAYSNALASGATEEAAQAAKATAMADTVKNMPMMQGVVTANAKAMDKTIAQVETRTALTEGFAVKLRANIELAKKAIAVLANTDTRYANEKINKLKGIKGNPEFLNAVQVLESISNETGKIETGSLGIGGLPEGARELWSKIHDPNLSVADLTKILNMGVVMANSAAKANTDLLNRMKTSRMTNLVGIDPAVDPETGRIIQTPIKEYEHLFNQAIAAANGTQAPVSTPVLQNHVWK